MAGVLTGGSRENTQYLVIPCHGRGHETADGGSALAHRFDQLPMVWEGKCSCFTARDEGDLDGEGKEAADISTGATGM